MQNTILQSNKLDALSIEQLRKFSPAIFAKEPDSEVSDRYGFIPTYSIIEGMHKHGFVPVEVRNYHRRDSGRRQHTKHMVKFRQAGTLPARTIGDCVPQIIMINSHDRTSNYQLYGGLMRLVCLNGLMVSEGAHVQPIRVRHTKNAVEEIVATSYDIVKHFKGVFKYVDIMRATKLTDKQQLQFAREALTRGRFPGNAGMVDPANLLVARRSADEGSDVWHVYNRVQENLSKGGIDGVTAAGRKTRTFPVKSITADLKLNGNLWGVAMEAIRRASTSSKAALAKLESEVA